MSFQQVSTTSKDTHVLEQFPQLVDNKKQAQAPKILLLICYLVVHFPQSLCQSTQGSSFCLLLNSVYQYKRNECEKNVLIVGLIASGSCYGSGFRWLLSNCSSQARGTIHLPLRETHKGSAYEHRGSLLANKHWDPTSAALQPNTSSPRRYLCTWKLRGCR